MEKKEFILFFLVIVLIFGAIFFSLPRIVTEGKAVLQQSGIRAYSPAYGFTVQKLNLSRIQIRPGGFTPAGGMQVFCPAEPKSIEANNGRSVIVPYCSHIFNSNGLKFKFYNLNGVLKIAAVKDFGTGDYMIDLQNVSNMPFFYYSSSPYSRGERLKINSFNSTAVNVSIEFNCDNISPYCYLRNWTGGQNNISRFHTETRGQFTVHLDKAGFESPQVLLAYANKTFNLTADVFNFFSTKLGFLPPMNKYVYVRYYNPNQASGGYSTNNIVYGTTNRVTTQQDLAWMLNGDAHEYTHVILYSAPLKRSWFEEGLADYLRHIYTRTINVYCNATGWQDLPFNDPRGIFVPYSNFSRQPVNNADIYDPTSRRAYYASAECFWVYVNATYGWNKVQQIVAKWHDLRKTFPPQEKYFIRDIVNPTLNADLSALVLQRYSYRE